MPFLSEDAWIDGHEGNATVCDVSILEDCAIGVDATYYLSLLLDHAPAHEPLLPALGGLTGIEGHLNDDLEQWKKHGIVPFFIFDGQSITGQDDVFLKRARASNRKTDEAWTLYSQSQADQAVSTFGANPGAFRIQSLYPLLQRILKRNGLRFLVVPYNACAQLAYFEMIDSDMCGGIMGPQELLLYPISDSVIRSFDWEASTVTAISKKRVMRSLGASEPLFIDAMLSTGTPFLPTFPALLDASLYPSPNGIIDAVNMLRTSEKSVATACAAFNDILQKHDPDWYDKYQKARLAVHHFIYIAESGEICVNDFDRLTGDHHKYFGLRLPDELFHYLNTGLISPRLMNSITHGQILIQPPLDGEAGAEYKKLVTNQIIPIKEQALGLIIPRLHRGIGHSTITLRVWFDPSFSYIINQTRSLNPPELKQAGSWDVKEQDLRSFFPADFAGPVYLEVLALANTDFVEKTMAKDKLIRGIDSAEMITSVTIWRFLHLRGYVNDDHKLTAWGNALATTLLSLKDAAEGRPEMPGLDEAALLAFELIRFGLLTGRYREGQLGLPRKGSDEDKTSLVLISQSATLLKLNHQAYGYTGPLNKSLLTFRALSSVVREADRDLVEAILASMFLFGQSKRVRDDELDINQSLPFLREPDIGLGIALRTFFDEDDGNESKEARAKRLEDFPKTFVPFAEALEEDFRNCIDFVSALNQGVQTLDVKELPAVDKAEWAKAQKYLENRPF